MPCSHLQSLPTELVKPQVGELVCQGCVAIGKRDWVQLRMCLECGHVGCCDSSPGMHATGHFTSTQHPIMQSFQPGQTWTWCYLDEEQADPGKKLYEMI